jgi:hypothetical protein
VTGFTYLVIGYSLGFLFAFALALLRDGRAR